MLVRTPALPVKDAPLSTVGKIASAAQLTPQSFSAESWHSLAPSVRHRAEPLPPPWSSQNLAEPPAHSRASLGKAGCRHHRCQTGASVFPVKHYSPGAYHWPAFGVGPGWPADLNVPALPSGFVLGQAPHFISRSQQSRSFPGRLAPRSFWIVLLGPIIFQ